MGFLHRIARHWVAPQPAGASCGNCRHFGNESFALEAAMPGYAVLGSALGSVRADDGRCALHGRTVGARAGCSRHAAPGPAAPVSSPS